MLDHLEEMKKKTSSNWTLLPKTLTAECSAFLGIPLQRENYCSSGMHIVLWALEKCGSVTVFGAVADPCYPFHYYDPMPEDCSVPASSYDALMHNFTREHLALERLHHEGRLKIHRFEDK